MEHGRYKPPGVPTHTGSLFSRAETDIVHVHLIQTRQVCVNSALGHSGEEDGQAFYRAFHVRGRLYSGGSVPSRIHHIHPGAEDLAWHGTACPDRLRCLVRSHQRELPSQTMHIGHMRWFCAEITIPAQISRHQTSGISLTSGILRGNQ